MRDHLLVAAAIFAFILATIFLSLWCERAFADPKPIKGLEYVGQIPGTDVRVWREDAWPDPRCTYVLSRIMGTEIATVSCQ